MISRRQFLRFLAGVGAFGASTATYGFGVEPVLRRLERVIRPRWVAPTDVTKRAVGVILLLLGALLLVPIPLSNLIPGLVIILLAFAYLEDDGVLLCLALVAALAALGLAAVAVWGMIKGIDFIDPKR